MIGNQLEEAGWRQGSIVNAIDLSTVLNDANYAIEEGMVLLVASQSCDIANNNLDSDPFIEVSVARSIDTLSGHLTHNKNPRTLHLNIIRKTGDENVFTEDNLEIRAYEKINIRKNVFASLSPDKNRSLEDRQLKSYVAWLAARYSRPALPTTFNDRVKNIDPRDKLRGKAKKGNEFLLGIYVEIIPDREIADDESYRVNLLGLLPAGFKEDRTSAEGIINDFAENLKKAGMDVTSAVRTENEVSLALIGRFKRFYYDDLSFRDNAPLPPEIENII